MTSTTPTPQQAFTVLAPGMATTVQDYPGRVGHWDVGVPPSGPMDDLSFQLANIAVGNPPHAAGLEAVLTGPTLQAHSQLVVAVAGATAAVTLNGRSVPQWQPLTMNDGDILTVGEPTTTGMRTYIAVRGGIATEPYLGSRSTFTLAQFGGHEGRALAAGDHLPIGAVNQPHFLTNPRRILESEQPYIPRHWEIAVVEGPHAAPDYFTRADIDTLYSTAYEVSGNSDRTGVRLLGPKPEWARATGGDAGMHPSNIHDNAYSVGTLDFTGDTPILLGPDGPSLGGFVCPLTVVSAERWKLGQLAPGDSVRFVPIPVHSAPRRDALGLARRSSISQMARATRHTHLVRSRGDGDDGVLSRFTVDESPMTIRRSGDDNILIEYGTPQISLEQRARVHALYTRLRENPIPGIIDLTPGIRSLQVHYDPDVVRQPYIAGLIQDMEEDAPHIDRLPSRHVRLPLSWDDPATRVAIERYMTGVRADAPWCPWNIEFIRRMNGLDSVEDVYNTVFSAEYLVMGLGDVYLGAPVAVPLDPRHRLVTTKYNPARTWTPENAVGIGGAYLCIYGMEGPGGYQFVGRTTQVWNHRHPQISPGFDEDHPWLLRFFDRISWYPVSAEELLEMRADVLAGKHHFDIEEDEFSLTEYRQFLAQNAEDIEATHARMEAARARERAYWVERGEITGAAAIEKILRDANKVAV